jgi:hypothetical protein
MAKREVKRIVSEAACKCYKKEIFLELNFSLSFADLPHFISLGYREKKSYTNSGLFYLEGTSLVAIGAIGNNRLQIKCKNPNCLEELGKLEAIIQEM